jgi:hypothetical protein
VPDREKNKLSKMSNEQRSEDPISLISCDVSLIQTEIQKLPEHSDFPIVQNESESCIPTAPNGPSG